MGQAKDTLETPEGSYWFACKIGATPADEVKKMVDTDRLQTLAPFEALNLLESW